MDPRDRVLIWGVLLARVLESRRDNAGRRGSSVGATAAAPSRVPNAPAGGVRGRWRDWWTLRRA